ncbi:hypothetical protein FS837_005047 [Tulasnella sp. UAMH 9824]|nr:hypothetical protein FS837_005047 [Tulasnella sp. UAMH 9824]
MWTQVRRVIHTHRIVFIASLAVLLTLGEEVELARITTPPAQPAPPSHIISSPYLSSELPYADPEDFWSDALPQDFGSLEWFGLAAPISGQSDFDDYQQEQDSSSETSYSWPEALPVEGEPSNTDSNALQGQGQSEFNAPLNEDRSQSPIAPVSDDFHGETPSPNQSWMAAFFYFGLPLGLLVITCLKVKYGQKLLAEVEAPLLRSRIEVLVKSHSASDGAFFEAHKALETQQRTMERAYQGLRRRDEQNGALKEENETLKEENKTLKEENKTLREENKTLKEISGGASSTPAQKVDESNENTEKLKGDVASLSVEDKELSTRLGRESELRFLMDMAEAHAERIRGSFVKNEKQVREAHEAKFQAITEASEARKEAERSRATAEASQLELDAKRAELESAQQQLAKFKDDVEAVRNETSITITLAEVAILKNASLKQALAESEENRASVQNEADAAFANLESQLNVQRLANEMLARDIEALGQRQRHPGNN